MLSNEICCGLKDVFFTESSDNLPLIAGGAAAGGIALAIIVIVIVVFLRIHTKHGKLVLSLLLSYTHNTEHRYQIDKLKQVLTQ